MLRKVLFAAVLLAALVAVLSLLPGEGAAQPGDERRAEPVRVVNFPDPQPVDGRVEVRGTPRQADGERLLEVVVSPARATDVNQWTAAGAFDTDGYGWLTLSLAGEVKGTLVAPGEVAAVLVPDEELPRRALREAGETMFALTATATAEPGRPFFASRSERLAVAFPRYRVYLYTTGDRSVEASLYAYLSN